VIISVEDAWNMEDDKRYSLAMCDFSVVEERCSWRAEGYDKDEAVAESEGLQQCCLLRSRRLSQLPGDVKTQSYDGTAQNLDFERWTVMVLRRLSCAAHKEMVHESPLVEAESRLLGKTWEV
jgi:hypothetical protein